MKTILCIMRTLWCIFKYQYVLRKAIFGSGLQVQGKLAIVGPGKVVIGNNCKFQADPWGDDYVTLFTHSPEAEIVIGDNVVMRGTRMGCFLTIKVQDDTVLENASIYDSDFHNIDATRRDDGFHDGDRQVEVGERSYIGCEVLCSKGSLLGEDVILLPGSVVGTKKIVNGSTLLGNPARS